MTTHLKAILPAGLIAAALLVLVASDARRWSAVTTAQPVFVDLAVIDEHVDDPFHSVLIR